MRSQPRIVCAAIRNNAGAEEKRKRKAEKRLKQLNK